MKNIIKFLSVIWLSSILLICFRECFAFGDPSSPFGIRGLTLATDRITKLIFDAGVRWHRFPIEWGNVEQKPGKFVWEEYDSLIKRMYDHNMNIVITLRCVPPSTSRKNLKEHTATMPKDIGKYLLFVKACVDRYKDKVKYWQVENEPSFRSKHWRGEPKDYARLLKEVYKVIKTVSPEGKVLIAGSPVKPVLGDNGTGFLSQVFKNGAGEYFDIFDLHCYGDVKMIPLGLTKVNKMLKNYGYFGQKTKPIWITETGTPGREPRFPEKKQAEDVIKRHALAFSKGVEKVFFWNAVDGIKDLPKFNIPVAKLCGLLDSNRNPKPAYFAYKLMTGKLNGFNSAADLSRDGIQIYQFSFKDKNPILILWKDDLEKPQTINLKDLLKKEKIALTSVPVKREQMEVKAEIIPADSIFVSGTPVFLE